MSIFKVNLEASHPMRRERTTRPLAALVDTGSELTWLPAEALRSIGVEASGRRALRTAKDETVEREVGYAVLRANGRETTEEVVFGEPGEATVLGARALEAFGVTMEDDTRFISLTSMMAFSAGRLLDSPSRAA